MGFSLFNNDLVFDIFALNGSMGKTFFSGRWLLAAGNWLFLKVAKIGLASRQLPEASSGG
jgi:lipid-A-disaccharide synthase-like uncharacterized protein